MLALLRSLPLVWQLGVGASVLAVGVGGYALWHHKVYRSGYDRAMHDIAMQNQEAVDAVNNVRARVRACHADSGMRWDQSTGECIRRH